MKIENEFSILKQPQCAVAYLGPATRSNRPGLAWPTASEAGPRGMTPVHAQRTHGAARPAQSACHGTARVWLTGG
jgi:hypothetical protein